MSTIIQGTDIDLQLTDKKLMQECLLNGSCNGLMGVPISYLDKHCPEQFEIVGISGDLAETIYIDGSKKSGRFYVKGTRLYDRIIIRKKVKK